MDSKGFLDNLLKKFDDGKTEISNIGFKDINNYFLKLLNTFVSEKCIICISSSYFNDNLGVISALKNRRTLEAIISLPIYDDGDNLIILIFNSKKTHNECLFIDESDSLVHKDDSFDWTYASEELVDRILKTYNEFEESDNAVILDIDEIFTNTSDSEILTFESEPVNTSKTKPNEELLTLKSDSPDISTKKRRVLSNDLADGLLSLKQKESINEELSKHNTKSVEIQQNTSLPFLNDAMYYKKRQNPKNLLYKEGERLIDGEVPFKKLGKIADLQNIYIKNDKDSILIATCKGCKSKLVFYNRDVKDFEGEVYIEITNISDAVSIDYLYEYLASSNGFDELLYFSKGNSHITPDNIKNLKVPVPELEIQKDIVKVSRESRELFKSVELLKKEFNSNILDYKHMQKSIDDLKGTITFDSKTNEITTLSRSWRHAYKGLIWPLAISYLSATKGGFESVEKKDNYLILFEFIAAFNTIVLLSGLPDDVYQRNYDEIWNSRNPNEYNQMTFANWVYISKNLADVYKFNNFTSQLDEELFEMISDDKILKILEYAKDLRNDEAHGSYSNAYEAEQIIEKLNDYLESIFDILEVYSDYKLIYTTGDYHSSNKGFSHRIISLNGPCAQPIYDDIIFDKILESKSLYLYNPKNNKKLLLKDNLIKFEPVDKYNRRWALFIYYSYNKHDKIAKYRCFQSREEDVKVSVSSLKRDILERAF